MNEDRIAAAAPNIGVMEQALAKLGAAANKAGSSVAGAMRLLADMNVMIVEAELAANPGWRWLKRRWLLRKLTKAQRRLIDCGGRDR